MAFAIMYVFALGLMEWMRDLGPEGKCIRVVEGGHPVSGDCTPEWLASDECMCLQDYFGGMLPSLLTLFQFLVFDDTFELVRPVWFVSLWYGKSPKRRSRRQSTKTGLLVETQSMFCVTIVLHPMFEYMCNGSH